MPSPLVRPKFPRGLMVTIVTDLADMVMGIIKIHYSLVPGVYAPPIVTKANLAYFSICLSLNVLLTLMIITRLFLHKRNIQHAMGTSGGSTKLYTTIIVMLVESYALYAIAFILCIVSFTLGASVFPVFAQVIAGMQVCTARPNLRMPSDCYEA